MSYHLPAEETLDPVRLLALQGERLGQVLQMIGDGPAGQFYQRKIGKRLHDQGTAGFADWPFTTRAELEQDQRDHPPFGSTLTRPTHEYVRFHQTSGTSGRPMRWVDRAADWEWWKRCWRVVMCGVGVRSDDRIAFFFSFGPFVGFWAAFEAGCSLGNLCLPGGGLSTLARLHYIVDNDVSVICCTPTYALRMMETAQLQGIDLARTGVRLLIVAGEPGGSVPGVRNRIESGFGARVADHAGMTEVGPWGFECEESPGALHITESEFVAEVIDPVTARSLGAEGDGELVLTNLGRLGNPLLRYRTGDVVRLRRGRCSCGRYFARLEGGILGRTDSMLIIRGNNVFPSAVEGIIQGFAQVAEFRLVVQEVAGMKELRVEVEPVAGADVSGLPERLSMAVRDRLHFRPQVTVVSPGSLPRFEMKSSRLVRGEG